MGINNCCTKTTNIIEEDGIQTIKEKDLKVIEEDKFPEHFKKIAKEKGFFRKIELSEDEKKEKIKNYIRKHSSHILEPVSSENEKDVSIFRAIANKVFRKTSGFKTEYFETYEDALETVKTKLGLLILNKKRKRIGVIVITPHQNGSITFGCFGILKKYRGNGYGSSTLKSLYEMNHGITGCHWGFWICTPSLKLASFYREKLHVVFCKDTKVKFSHVSKDCYLLFGFC